MCLMLPFTTRSVHPRTEGGCRYVLSISSSTLYNGHIFWNISEKSLHLLPVNPAFPLVKAQHISRDQLIDE